MDLPLATAASQGSSLPGAPSRERGWDPSLPAPGASTGRALAAPAASRFGGGIPSRGVPSRGEDAELGARRAGVNCATVLEKLVPGWRLDRRESTRRCLKYRRGAGEVLIVNHDGRGWWDPLSDAKGDVFSLVQHLDPGLDFGEVRRVLRDFVGIAPSYPALGRGSRRKTPASRSRSAGGSAGRLHGGRRRGAT